MDRIEAYILNVSDADKFILRTTKQFHVFEVFGKQCRARIDKVFKSDKLYFYVTTTGKRVTSVTCNTQFQRFEFGSYVPLDLVKAYKDQKLRTPKEGRNMFSNFKIVEVETVDVNAVALEAAIEKVAKTMDDVEIREKDGKSYLVKDGSAIEINGNEFKDLVVKYVVGKTEAELTRNTSMYQLIRSLGIIKSAKVEADQSDLSSIFG